MTDTTIFLIGLFTFLLFSGGVTFTLLEVQRLGTEATAKASNRQKPSAIRKSA